jgi:hypothetical protein
MSKETEKYLARLVEVMGKLERGIALDNEDSVLPSALVLRVMVNSQRDVRHMCEGLDAPYITCVVRGETL